MKKVFILLLSLVFIVAMTACQTTLVPADVADTVDPSDTVDSGAPEETVKTAALAGSYKLTLDVNPSIELTVKDGLVTGAAAYNDDGKAILLSANVTGLSANSAIDAIISEIAAAGYLNKADKEPYVLVTVAGGADNPELRDELEDYTEKALEAAGVDGDVKSAVVSDDTASGAAAQGMSAGRYMVLQYIAKEKGITFEEAVALYGTMSISQLMEQFEDLDEAFDEDGNDDIEDADDQDEENVQEDNDDQDDNQDDDRNEDHDDDEHSGGSDDGDDQGEDD